MRSRLLFGAAIALSILVATSTLAQSVCAPGEIMVPADRDNTLYEADMGVGVSNGAGDYFFAGADGDVILRRATLHFDVGAVPPGAVVTDATLWLNMSRTISGPQDVSLHALTADWGEGASHASGQEGMGAASMTDDASWFHTFYDTDFWTTPGGDFVAGASATTSVDDLGAYSWAGAGLIADVQDWVDTPASNFGWILIGQEASSATAKRFDSKDNATGGVPPVLCVGAVSAPSEIPTLDPRALALLALLLAGAALSRFRS